ncbi:hypothetical protein AB1L12_04610 [Peribacillus frigoritolerans]|uniref:hypothetical protein n=1 Tax=Peribacillus frigoritolerans TaxID=450367 RepID=UPI0039A1E6F2
MEKLDHVVYLYNRNMAGSENWKLSDFRNKSKPLEELIKDAVYGRLPNLKQDSHQTQIDRNVLDEMERRLLDKAIIDKFKKCKDFLDLFTNVYDESIPGFGSLCVYDTSIRLGAVFNIYPDVVFLHCGALDGARNLLGKNKLDTLIIDYNEDPRYPCILKDDLPEELQSIEAHHLENFFCRFKERLKTVKSSITAN